MNEYPAKSAYKNAHSATQYDKIRFTSTRGKYLDRLERRSVLCCMSKAFAGKSPETIHVLDIPCGTGRITETLLSAGYKTSGSDISREMMEIAGKRLSAYPGFQKLYQEDIEKLSFHDSMFNAATCVRLMGHLPTEKKKAALGELKRVSRDFVIVTFYISNIKNNFKQKIMNRLLHKTAPWYSLNRREIASLVHDCRMEIITYCDVHKIISEASTYLLRV